MKKITLIALVLFSLLQLSCKKEKQKVTGVDEMRQELIKIATAENENASFSYKTIEEARQIEVTLSNKKVGKQVVFNTRDTSLLLGYHSKKLIDAQKAEITKFEIIKKDSVVSLKISRNNGQTLSEHKFIARDKVLKVPSINRANNFGDCVNEFFCNQEFFKCEANRTCETQYYAVFCCDNENECISIHYIFEPDNPFCRFRPIAFDFPILVAR